MSPELWVGLVAVFVSGGAIGSAGTLLAQWLVRKVHSPLPPRQALGGAELAELEVLRSEVFEMSRQLQNLDARLDFTERLLDGAIPLQPPPERLADTRPSARPDDPSSPADPGKPVDPT